MARQLTNGHPGRDGEPATAMADDAPEREIRPARPTTGMWEHLCHHPDCGLWGAWGFQRGKGEQRWYCSTHRDEGERFFLGRRAPDANGRAHGAGAETHFDGETR